MNSTFLPIIPTNTNPAIRSMQIPDHFGVGNNWMNEAPLPAGFVAYFTYTTAPTGWLKCNGAAISRTTYASLFSVIGTTFGSGDGSTTFNVPELRGEFIRGYDDGRGVDSGRTFGSYQADDNKSHTHTYVRGGYTNYYISPDGGLPTSESANTTGSSGGPEAKPKNHALLCCVKY